jgi:hypothetical protein
MKNIIMMSSVAVLSLGLMVSAACSDSETSTAQGGGGAGATGGSGGSGATGGGGGAEPVEVPTLGSQIDRKGRPAINTATVNTFDIAEIGNTPDPDATRATAEAEYNSNDDPTTWATDYAAVIRDNLAILDALNVTCGDQAFYGNPLGIAGLTDYLTLATVLANDWLVVDSAHTDCGYLGVELELGGTDDLTCGGRTLTDDVMDATYGAVSGAAGFGDTIDAPSAAPSDTFPYLADASANPDP